nr:hypothetical protein [Tanacetum cinerariifolium]
MIHCSIKANVARNFLRLKDFDGIQPSYNNYLIDVASYVTNVVRTNHLKSGSRNLDFHLANHRGQSIGVTLWSGLGDVLMEKKTKQTGVCPVILTSTCPKMYNNKVYLSSTSSTVFTMMSSFLQSRHWKKQTVLWSNRPLERLLTSLNPRLGLLRTSLCGLTKGKSDSIIFHCKVTIDGINTSKGWNFSSCGSDTSTTLVKCSADSLMDTTDESAKDHLSLLPALSNLIGIVHVMEIKSHTYYEYGTFESFTCWQIHPMEGIKDIVGSNTVDAVPDNQPHNLKRIAQDPSI